MVPSWHWPNATLISDKCELGFVFLCDHSTRLDGLIDLVGLALIQEDLLSDYFNQVIGRRKAAVTFLNQPTEYIRNIVVHFVAVSQLLAPLVYGVHSMVASS